MAHEQSFIAGEAIKVISGPFATYRGEIVDVNDDKQMLKVLVRLENNPLVRAGAGELAVELRYREVEKIAL